MCYLKMILMHENDADAIRYKHEIKELKKEIA